LGWAFFVSPFGVLFVTNTAVEIEVSGPNAMRLQFEPIGRSLRGAVDFSTLRTHDANDQRTRWPDPVPGKVIGVAADGQKYIREPLHEAKYDKLRKQISNRGFLIPEERETFDSETAITWRYWMRRAVDAGYARIIKGSLPEIAEFEPPKPPADPSKPRKNFLLAETDNKNPLAESLDKLAASVAAQTVVMMKLLEKLK
jgi:hypothetical protein